MSTQPEQSKETLEQFLARGGAATKLEPGPEPKEQSRRPDHRGFTARATADGNRAFNTKRSSKTSNMIGRSSL